MITLKTRPNTTKKISSDRNLFKIKLLENITLNNEKMESKKSLIMQKLSRESTHVTKSSKIIIIPSLIKEIKDIKAISNGNIHYNLTIYL